MALFSEAATMRDISIAGNSIKNKLQKTRTKEITIKSEVKNPKLEQIKFQTSNPIQSRNFEILKKYKEPGTKTQKPTKFCPQG